MQHIINWREVQRGSSSSLEAVRGRRMSQENMLLQSSDDDAGDSHDLSSQADEHSQSDLHSQTEDLVSVVDDESASAHGGPPDRFASSPSIPSSPTPILGEREIVSELRKNLEEKEMEIARLRISLKEIKESSDVVLQRLEDELKAQSLELKECEEDLFASNTKCKALARSLKAERAKGRADRGDADVGVEEELERLRFEYEKCKDELSYCEEELEEARAQAEEFKKGMEEARAQAEEFKKGIEEARAQAEEFKKGIEEARAQAEEFKKGMEEARAQAEEFKKGMMDLELKRQQANRESLDEIARLKSLVSSLQANQRRGGAGRGLVGDVDDAISEDLNAYSTGLDLINAPSDEGQGQGLDEAAIQERVLRLNRQLQTCKERAQTLLDDAI